jgi:hypothetical protein
MHESFQLKGITERHLSARESANRRNAMALSRLASILRLLSLAVFVVSTHGCAAHTAGSLRDSLVRMDANDSGGSRYLVAAASGQVYIATLYPMRGGPHAASQLLSSDDADHYLVLSPRTYDSETARGMLERHAVYENLPPPEYPEPTADAYARAHPIKALIRGEFELTRKLLHSVFDPPFDYR